MQNFSIPMHVRALLETKIVVTLESSKLGILTNGDLGKLGMFYFLIHVLVTWVY